MSDRLRNLIWFLVLLLSIAAIGWQTLHRVVPQLDEDDIPAASLLSLPYSKWLSVDMVYRGRRMRFERDPSGYWFIHPTVGGDAANHVHTVIKVDSQRIDDVLSVFSRTRIERTIGADEEGMPNYGLSNPELIVLIQGNNGHVASTIEVGQVAVDDLSRYVHVPQIHKIYTIPNYQIRNLLALVAVDSIPGR